MTITALQSATVVNSRKQTYPEFVMLLTEQMRSTSAQDTVIRIRIDMSSKTAIGFTAHWLERKSSMFDIHRRVYVETKLNELGKYVVVFMSKAFDENATVVEYAREYFNEIAVDVQRFLRMNRLPV